MSGDYIKNTQGLRCYATTNGGDKQVIPIHRYREKFSKMKSLLKP